MEKTISQKKYKPYICIGAFLAVFAAMFSVNFVLPIKQVLCIPFHDIQERAWTWCELIICLLASYCILRVRKFTLLDLIVGIVLGVIVKYAGWYTYVSAISTTICYYSACQIFRKYKQENKYFNISIKKLLRSLLLGILLAIPFAIINNLSMYFMNGSSFKGFDVNKIIPEALHALPPGISEEIIFHFFLLAFATLVFGGSIPKNKFALFLVYFMCVVPHTLIHLPNVFVNSFTTGLIVLVFLSLIFGTPMVWLIRNKNLQTSMAFHWFIDFIRFIF